jgi:branched-chain amino acid transport system permease protein
MDEARFLFALLVDGTLVGLMYSLIAVGFVLIYKTTGAINFAQGELVMLAGMAAAAGAAAGMGFWAVLGITIAILVAVSIALEHVVLRPMVGRPVITLVMATIGIAAVLRGLGPLVFGIGTRPVPVPFNDAPWVLGPFMIPPVQLAGALCCLGLVAGLTIFFARSRAGLAFRAIADSQPVAQAMGIDVPRYFAYAWGLAGLVSALGGVFWGMLLGADNQLSVIGLKVFPVVILGGLDSIAGSVVAGIAVGIVENLTAGYLDSYAGGGTKDLIPFLMVIAVLMFRPFGLFGTKVVERI